MKADLIVTNIGELITCASAGKSKRGVEMRNVGLVRNAAVAITDGNFVAVGNTTEILSRFSSDQTLDAQGKVVCPGLVDPHTHIAYAGDRLDEFELKIQGAEYLEIMEKGGGIMSTVRKTREASAEELVEQGLHRLDKMLACGTTTAEIKTGYGLDTETELKMLRVIEELDRTHPIEIVPTFMAAHTIPMEFKATADRYVALICDEMFPLAWEWYQASHFKRAETPFFADVFCEKNAFDIAQSRRILETASRIGFKLKAHVDQFTNVGGSALGVDLGAASIDHLDAISESEIEALAQSETVGVVIPTENFNAGKTVFADARKMIDAGCAIALSTDYNPGSAPCPSLPMAMAIACRYQKLLPAEAINAATLNAAHAIGLGKTHGSVEPGKKADLVLLDCLDHRELAYEFGGSLVISVIKDGKIVFSSE